MILLIFVEVIDFFSWYTEIAPPVGLFRYIRLIFFDGLPYTLHKTYKNNAYWNLYPRPVVETGNFQNWKFFSYYGDIKQNVKNYTEIAPRDPTDLIILIE